MERRKKKGKKEREKKCRKLNNLHTDCTKAPIRRCYVRCIWHTSELHALFNVLKYRCTQHSHNYQGNGNSPT